MKKYIKSSICCFILTLLLALPAQGGSAAVRSPGPQLADRPAVGNLNAYGPASSIHYVSAPDLPGQSAIRIDVPEPSSGSQPWDIAVAAVSTAQISKGDLVVAAFWVRSEQGGKIVARMQSNDAPYAGISESTIALEKTWKLVLIKGVAQETLPANHASLTLSLNLQKQVVDVGPMVVIKNPTTTSDLPDRLRSLPLGGVFDTMVDVGNDVKLAVTMRVPAGKGPFPAVLQITGSGPWGRNPSDAVANALLENGVAVVQFDKRGVGQSTGNYAQSSLDDRVSDVEALTGWLRSQPQVKGARTGLVGASEGALIAYKVAARQKYVKFLVLLAPPALPISELGILQNEYALRDAGAPEAQIALNTSMLRAVAAAVQAASGDDDAVNRVKGALAPYIGRIFSQEEAATFAESFRNPGYRATYLYDPKCDLEKIRAPVLALFGTVDHQVPAFENAAALKAALVADKDVSVRILPGFNHIFQHAKLGTTAEWEQLKEPQASDPQLLSIVTGWVSKQTK
jgi:dienelactone hydrolase